MALVRRERPADLAAVRQVHEQAFGRSNEADLVDALRRLCLKTMENERLLG